ncbi:MAG TPA: Type 1 glutamine amidotransferase-like domain-containing protein [Steroidobacteraceae bacterium]|nr:Type 1 glutamine amidotransferase-like domain-containing protein [Steroidobacteraceae bacterium]
MSDHAFLGPQYRRPHLRECLESLGIIGPLVSITAGWQEREGEIEELRAHVAMPVSDLGLYARAEHVHAADPALAAATRERQDRLQELQDLYRVRLASLMGAVAELAAQPGASPALRRARLSALGDVRRLDRQHLLATQREHHSFAHHWQPGRRPSIVPHVETLRAAIERAAAVLIAGGHVAVLLNRLRLFGVAALARGKPLIAWSAGAMAVSDRVVLFHDRPPQGAAHAEVLEAGLGLVPGVVPLPHAHVRLALDDAGRVREFARRFAPARCLTLEHGSLLRWHRGRLIEARDVRRLARSGQVADVQA